MPMVVLVNQLEANLPWTTLDHKLLWALNLEDRLAVH
jgi:hypothetical protein